MKTLKLIVVIAVVLSTTSCKLFKQKQMFSKDIDTTTYVQDDASVIDTQEIETIAQETVPVSTSEPMYGYTNEKFYMIVGSFLNEKLAYKYAQKMQSQGYSPQILHSSSTGFYRVSAKAYDNYKTAINDIASFRDNVTPRAWVHVRQK